jgi:hypothetical protein
MDKSKAVTTAINAAVEAFITDNMTDADYFFEMAEEFHRADEELFADDPNNYTRSQ